MSQDKKYNVFKRNRELALENAVLHQTIQSMKDEVAQARTWLQEKNDREAEYSRAIRENENLRMQLAIERGKNQYLEGKNKEVTKKNQQLCDVVKHQGDLITEVQKANEFFRKKLAVRSGHEDPYGLNTPSSRKVSKKNSSEENQAKKGGAKVNHKGSGRKNLNHEPVDEIVDAPDVQPTCSCGEKDVKFIENEKRRLLKIVPAKVLIVEETRGRYYCPKCNKYFTTRSHCAQDHSMYDFQSQAVCCDEVYGNNMPINEVSRRYNIRRGTLVNQFHNIGNFLKPIWEEIAKGISHCKFLHADETGWSTDGKRSFVWGFFNESYALYQIRDSRGSKVPLEIFSEPSYDIILITDRYGAYNLLPVKHQYCFVHLMRDLKKLMEEEPENHEVQTFGINLMEFFKKIYELKKKNLPLEQFKTQAHALKDEIMAVCNSEAKDPGVQKFQNIFRTKEDSLFRWTDDPDIQCDNNTAERSLRKLVIARKISFGSQSPKGAKTREIITSVIHTLRQRGIDSVKFLTDILIEHNLNAALDIRAFFHGYKPSGSPSTSSP